MTAKLRLRRAARILLVDSSGRLLMFRFVVPGRAPFWVTAGGECDPGESFADAARRELREETGLEAEPGPEVACIRPQFVTVEGERVQAEERYFRVHTDIVEIDTGGHTALEQQVMQEHRWFTPEELNAWPEAIFPENVAELIAQG